MSLMEEEDLKVVLNFYTLHALSTFKNRQQATEALFNYLAPLNVIV